MPHYQVVIHKYRVERGKIDLPKLVEVGEALVKRWPFEGVILEGMTLNVAEQGYSDYVVEVLRVEPCMGLNKIRLHCKLLSKGQYEALSKEKFGWLKPNQLE